MTLNMNIYDENNNNSIVPVFVFQSLVYSGIAIYISTEA